MHDIIVIYITLLLYICIIYKLFYVSIIFMIL